MYAVAQSEKEVPARAVDLGIQEVEVRECYASDVRYVRAVVACAYLIKLPAFGVCPCHDIIGNWCRTIGSCRRGGCPYSGVAWKRYADLVSDEELEVVAAAIYIDVPGD